MIARKVVIRGRVQGVGYRDWLVHKAQEAGMRGWVRNRENGTVEALLAGSPEAVHDMIRRCRRGPRLADVTSIDEAEAEVPAEPGFVRRETA